MENSTRYDLNGAIQAWRSQLNGSPALKAESIEELEGHLRDSISRLCASGLSEKEAFLIARQRLGGVEELEQEYGKVHREPARSPQNLWMWLGAFVLGAAGVLTGALFIMLPGLVMPFYSPGSLPASFSGSPPGVLLILALAAMAGALLLNRRAFARLAAIGLAGVLLLMVAPTWMAQWMVPVQHPHGPFPVSIPGPFYQMLPLLILAAIVLGALPRNMLGAFAILGLGSIFLLITVPSFVGMLVPGSYPFRSAPEYYPASMIGFLLLFLAIAAVIWSLLRQEKRTEIKSA